MTCAAPTKRPRCRRRHTRSTALRTCSPDSTCSGPRRCARRRRARSPSRMQSSGGRRRASPALVPDRRRSRLWRRRPAAEPRCRRCPHRLRRAQRRPRAQREAAAAAAAETERSAIQRRVTSSMGSPSSGASSARHARRTRRAGRTPRATTAGRSAWRCIRSGARPSTSWDTFCTCASATMPSASSGVAGATLSSTSSAPAACATGGARSARRGTTTAHARRAGARWSSPRRAATGGISSSRFPPSTLLPACTSPTGRRASPSRSTRRTHGEWGSSASCRAPCRRSACRLRRACAPRSPAASDLGWEAGCPTSESAVRACLTPRRGRRAR
mmetsp:Transcript_43385/g.144502  ORF Transcript_43385/g.144502 Transcript_43385/m.144502 type:complete len:330 (+) Transcript_43385:899-1888(+)